MTNVARRPSLAAAVGLVLGVAPARAQVGRIEGEWRDRTGVDIVIWATGLGWSFRGTAGAGWGEQGMLPNTVEFHFDAAACWLPVTMSEDQSRMQLGLILALDRRCRSLVGDFERISD